MIKRKPNILQFTPDFNYSDGRSYYVYLLLKYLKKAGHNVFLCTNSGDSFERLKEFDIPVFVHPPLSKKSSFPDSVRYINKIVKVNSIDIIHSHHRLNELIANAARKKSKVRTVFTSLSLVNKRYFVEYRSDRLIAVSNCVKEMLIGKFKVNENEIVLIPNFADSEEFAGNREPGIVNPKSLTGNHRSGLKNKQTCILSIGRFHKEKDFETLLKAISLIKDHRIKLIMIGAGEEKESYLNIIKKNSIDVEIISPQRYLNAYFKIADMCVLASVRDPLPSFMLQSGLFNKPFIGTDVDGIREVIQDGINGLLFEKKNEIQLSEKIRLFIDEPLFAKKCAYNLHKLVIEKFTEKSVIPELEKLYSDLMQTK